MGYLRCVTRTRMIMSMTHNTNWWNMKTCVVIISSITEKNRSLLRNGLVTRSKIILKRKILCIRVGNVRTWKWHLQASKRERGTKLFGRRCRRHYVGERCVTDLCSGVRGKHVLFCNRAKSTSLCCVLVQEATIVSAGQTVWKARVELIWHKVNEVWWLT